MSRAFALCGLVFLAACIGLCFPALKYDLEPTYYTVSIVVFPSQVHTTQEELMKCRTYGQMLRSQERLEQMFPGVQDERFNGLNLLHSTEVFVSSVSGFETLSVNYYSSRRERMLEISQCITLEICREAQARFHDFSIAYYSFDDISRKRTENGFSVAAFLFGALSFGVFAVSVAARRTKWRYRFFDQARC